MTVSLNLSNVKLGQSLNFWQGAEIRSTQEFIKINDCVALLSRNTVKIVKFALIYDAIKSLSGPRIAYKITNNNSTTTKPITPLISAF